MDVSTFATSLSPQSTIDAVTTLILYSFCIVVYCIFIYNFYHFISKKNILKLDLQKYNKVTHFLFKKIARTVLYTAEYLTIFPLLIFFWFSVISAMLVVISDKLNISQILLVAMTMVVTIRICAYYSEELATELAKLFPFTLLAVFLLDINLLSMDTIVDKVQGIPAHYMQLLSYLLVTFAIEMALRAALRIANHFVPKEKKKIKLRNQKKK